MDMTSTGGGGGDHKEDPEETRGSVDSSGGDIVERSPGNRYVRFDERLGSGAYKDVFRAFDTHEGIEVAWNRVNLHGIPKQDMARIINEVRLLEHLNHPNIISFHGSWVNREKEQVVFVTEILSSGTLKNFINKVQVIRWKIAKRWAIQILNGLAYLHDQSPPVTHRDLKCDNIFINGTSGDLRIGDLGLSTSLNRSKALSVLGTPEFMAPELYDENYDEKVDIYAFGMCLLEIFTKEVPYSECTNPAQIYKKVTNQIQPKSLARIISQEAKEFIELCIDTEPKKRPTASELLKHPFLAQVNDEDDSEVAVRPPHNMDSLREVAERSTEFTSNPSMNSLPPKPTKESSSSHISHKSAQVSAPAVVGRPPTPIDSIDESETTRSSFDEFKGMQNSEENMKSVTVLMGRDQPLSEAPPPLSAADEEPLGDSSEVIKGTSSSDQQYIVAAECMEEILTNNMMKLIISIPMNGQTQHIQFDFHLVEDDPVRVAKEMVTELHIPEAAILEISETIGGLARDARVNQEKLRQKQLMDQQQNSVQVEKDPRQQQAAPPTSQTNAAPVLEEKKTTQEESIDASASEATESIPFDLSQHESEIAEEEAEELRKLEDEYRKSLERSKKAYNTRMENLQRSIKEKEAQHKKLIEKYEKEMIDFEKRLKQAEVEQTKRLEQLEVDWKRKQEKLRQSRPVLVPVGQEKHSAETKNESCVSLLSMGSGSESLPAKSAIGKANDQSSNLSSIPHE